ncbi:hypothetical protein [Stenotrophomonas bentonitica]
MIPKYLSANALTVAALAIGVGTLAILAEAGIWTSLAISTLVLTSALLVLATSGLPKSWVAATLLVKTLYAADLLLAMYDGRPLRYAPEVGASAAELRAQTLLMLCVWAAAFCAAASFSSNSRLFSYTKMPDGVSGKVIPMLLIAISQVAFILIVKQVGGISMMLSSMSSRYEVYFGIGFLRVAVGAGAIGCAMYYLQGKRWRSWIITVAIFIELALLGGRSFALFSTLIPIAMLWLCSLKRIPIGRTALITASAVIFVSALGTYRSSQLSQQYHAATGVFSKLVIDTGAADNFPSLLSMLRRDVTPYAGIEIVSSSLFAPIPRAIWNEKPMTDEAAAIGTILANADTVNWGLPIGPHGLAYYTAGAIAVPIFGLISGLFFGFVLNRTQRSAAWMATSPFILLLAPDILSPSTAARAIVLIMITIAISFAIRLRFRK